MNRLSKLMTLFLALCLAFVAVSLSSALADNPATPAGSGIGPRGPMGPRGFTGPAGPGGDAGLTGPAGPSNFTPVFVENVPLIGLYTFLYWVPTTDFTITDAYTVFNTAAIATTGTFVQLYSDGTHTCTATYNCATQTNSPAVVHAALTGSCVMTGGATVSMQLGGTDMCSGLGTELPIQQWFSGGY